MAVEKSRFDSISQLVIDRLEGGYYNPSWHSTGDARYSSSGETMFGIDRKNGGSLNDSAAGKQFWSIIDANKNPKVWKWNYRGGELEPKLKSLVSDIMYPHYERLARRYLSPKAKEIVDSDNRLLFHFIYSAWNGEGWFKSFAGKFNDAVNRGVTDTDKLTQIAIDSRINNTSKNSKARSLISQGGQKIAGFIDSLKGYTQQTVKKTVEATKENPVPTLLIFVAVTISAYVLYKTIKGKKR